MKFKLSLISFLLIAQVGFAASSATCFDTDASIMLHGDGSNGSTTITNENSTYAFTARSSTTISTAQLKFGTGSILINGGAVDTPDNAIWDIGTGDFTVDFWVRHISQVNGRYFFSHGASPTFGARVVSGELVVTLAGVGVYNQAWTPSNDTWYHIAVTRSGTSLRVFVDGTQLGATVTNSSNITGGATVFSIGAFNDGSNVHNGYIEEFRLASGVAVWTSNFTPPTAAYSASCSAGGSVATFTQSGIGFGNYQIA